MDSRLRGNDRLVSTAASADGTPFPRPRFLRDFFRFTGHLRRFGLGDVFDVARLHVDGCPFEAELFTQAILEISEPRDVDRHLVAADRDEERWRLDADLRGLMDVGRRRARRLDRLLARDDGLEEPLEGVVRDTTATFFADAERHVEELVRTLTLLCGDEDDRRPREERERLADGGLEFLRGHHVLVRDEIPFVRDEDESATGILEQSGEAFILRPRVFRGVEHEECDVRAREDLAVPFDAGRLHAFRDAAAFAHASRVHERHVFLTIFEGRILRLARRVRDRRDDDALFAEDGVHEGRFADVRSSHDDETEPLVRLDGLWRFAGLLKLIDHHVQKIADASACASGDGEAFAEAKIEHVRRRGEAGGAGVVDLVRDEEDALVQLFGMSCEVAVLRHDAALAVDQEEHEVGFLDGDLGLSEDAASDLRPLFRVHAARVDDLTSGPTPEAEAVIAVARGVCDGRDDGARGLGQPVPQRGLADVGASHDRDDGELF